MITFLRKYSGGFFVLTETTDTFDSDKSQNMHYNSIIG